MLQNQQKHIRYCHYFSFTHRFYLQYRQCINQKTNINVSELIIRLFAGFTEPDSISWFNKASAGMILSFLLNWSLVTNYSGFYLTFIWMALAFFMNMAYLSVLRNQLIRPQFQKPINTLEEAEYVTKPMFVPVSMGYVL